jgi:hypothetical protein
MIGWVIVLALWMTYIEVEHPNRMHEIEAEADYEEHSI